MAKKTAVNMTLDPNKPEGKHKLLGGGKADEWNDRLSDLTVNALPIAQLQNKDTITKACLLLPTARLIWRQLIRSREY